jgi:hypothetical protein
LLSCFRAKLRYPEQAGHYNLPDQLVNLRVNLTLKHPTLPKSLPRKNCVLYSYNQNRQAVIFTRANFLLPT